MPKDGVDLGPGAVVLGTRECGPWECLKEKRNRLRRVPRCGMKWNRPADRSLPWVGRDGLGAPTCRRRREVGEKWSLRLRRSPWSLVLGPWSSLRGAKLDSSAVHVRIMSRANAHLMIDQGLRTKDAAQPQTKDVRSLLLSRASLRSGANATGWHPPRRHCCSTA
jgi:hypothetical protein